MKFFTEKRFIYQQQPVNPETQPQPVPSTEAAKIETKEPLSLGVDTGKETPTSAQSVSDKYKDDGNKYKSAADRNLLLLANLKTS